MRRPGGQRHPPAWSGITPIWKIDSHCNLPPMSRGIRSSRTEFRRRLRRRCRFRRSRAQWCWRFRPRSFPRTQRVFARVDFRRQSRKQGRPKPPASLADPRSGARRRSVGKLAPLGAGFAKLQTDVGRSLRILLACARNRRTFCLHARERSRRHAAELVVAIITQVALRRSAAGAIGLNFNFEANLHDLIGRHSEIRRWQVCVEVHGCE